MPRRIPPQKAKAIKARADRPPSSQRKLADEFGVARGTVASIMQEQESKSMTTNTKPIRFKKCAPYFCDDCQRTVELMPCPACVAREAKANGQRAVADGVSDVLASHKCAPYFCLDCQRMVSVKPCPACAALEGKANEHPVDDVFEIDVPDNVCEWLNERLEKMICPTGAHAEVADAIELMVSKMTQVIASIAGVIGEERRSEYLKKKARRRRGKDS